MNEVGVIHTSDDLAHLLIIMLLIDFNFRLNLKGNVEGD